MAGSSAENTQNRQQKSARIYHPLQEPAGSKIFSYHKFLLRFRYAHFTGGFFRRACELCTSGGVVSATTVHREGGPNPRLAYHLPMGLASLVKPQK